MKHIDEYRDGELARGLAARIAQQARPDKIYRFMEFCGGHTHAIARYGLESLLPSNVRMIHGPGCPVCVLPMAKVDAAISLAHEPGVIFCAYGDAMRVPGAGGRSLLRARAEGADARMIYSPLDALAFARENPHRDVVFFAIGFETTTPPTALALQTARAENLKNFFVFCNHVLTPPAIAHILSDRNARQSAAGESAAPKLDGLIGPAHVSAIIGVKPYAPFAQAGAPVVVAGFEPLDVLMAISMLIAQVETGRAEVENQYSRAVAPAGNQKAQKLMAETFEPRESFEWRGLGFLPHSGVKLRREWAQFDAEERFTIPQSQARDNPACDCGAILRGVKQPRDCKLFGKACTPQTPIGACMVSSEGACAAHWAYGRLRSDSHEPSAQRAAS